MKIIGGDKRGKKIYAPKSRQIRITTDKVKESLFNILPPMHGVSFLDLYAGTGNIGIEALSRGAKMVVFVEKVFLHAQTIRRNLTLCGFNVGYQIIKGGAERGIALLAKGGVTFDVIFADPPYERDLVNRTISCVELSGVLKKNGIMAVEHSMREEAVMNDMFILTDQKRYGDTIISFLKFCE
jgi:16S rRNA (guanine(966)-N(2))-methyltransferase RsmD